MSPSSIGNVYRWIDMQTVFHFDGHKEIRLYKGAYWLTCTPGCTSMRAFLARMRTLRKVNIRGPLFSALRALPNLEKVRRNDVRKASLTFPFTYL